MRLFGIALFISLSGAVADQPGRSLRPDEMKALQQPIAVGRHILNALSQYSNAAAHEANGESANMWSRGMNQLGLLTRTPTIEVLHAAGYISDSDFTLAQRYRATPQPLPANQGLATRLTMQTHRGELLFDTRGDIALRQHQ
jgi:hypothetical protein